MTWNLYPAIDLLNGKCVRLTQGDYEKETVFGDDPLQVAERFVEAGAKWLHVVDLEAARSGKMEHLPLIRSLIRTVSIPVQVGGGVRDLGRLEALLEAGASRVVIGSALLDDPDFVREALRKHGDRIAIGLDARDGKVAIHGWRETSEVTAVDLAKRWAEEGAQTFIYTDIARDGMLTGVKGGDVRELARASGQSVIASGGVSSVEDLVALTRLENEGVVGAIVGKALYTGAISLSEALRRIEEEKAR